MKLFVANWKMHKTRGEARTYAAELGERVGNGPVSYTHLTLPTNSRV